MEVALVNPIYPSGTDRRARAADRPSAIAQTMRDWPRCMSPAVKMPGTLVIHRSSRHTLPRSVILTPSSVEHAVGLGPQEAHRQQHQIGLQLELAAGDRLELHPSVRHGNFDLVRMQGGDPALRVTGEPLRRDGVQTVAALLVRARDAEDVRPERPRVRVGAAVGRPCQQLELMHALAHPGGARCRGSRRRCRPRR